MGKLSLCQKCHEVKHTLFPCKRCGASVCSACFYHGDGLCCDCVTDKFNQDYKEKIKSYSEKGAVGL